jgi:hypothetical protein
MYWSSILVLHFCHIACQHHYLISIVDTDALDLQEESDNSCVAITTRPHQGGPATLQGISMFSVAIDSMQTNYDQRVVIEDLACKQHLRYLRFLASAENNAWITPSRWSPMCTALKYSCLVLLHHRSVLRLSTPYMMH